MRIANIAASLLVVGIYAAILFAKDVTSYTVGEFCGRLLATFLLALVLGKVLWLLARKNQMAGQAGFLAGLGWGVIGSLVAIGMSLEKPQTVASVQAETVEYSEALEAHLKDPEHNPEPDREEYFASIQKEIESHKGDPESDDTRLVELMGEATRVAAEKSAAWENVMQRVDAATLWDFAVIDAKEQLEPRLALITEYDACVREYQAWYQRRVKEISDHPTLSQVSPKHRAEFLTGMNAKANQLQEPMDNLFAAHLKNAAQLQAVTELMGEQWGSWRIRESDGLIEFDDDAAASNYERILDTAIAAEEEINAAALEVARLQQTRPREVASR